MIDGITTSCLSLCGFDLHREPESLRLRPALAGCLVNGATVSDYYGLSASAMSSQPDCLEHPVEVQT